MFGSLVGHLSQLGACIQSRLPHAHFALTTLRRLDNIQLETGALPSLTASYWAVGTSTITIRVDKCLSK